MDGLNNTVLLKRLAQDANRAGVPREVGGRGLNVGRREEDPGAWIQRPEFRQDLQAGHSIHYNIEKNDGGFAEGISFEGFHSVLGLIDAVTGFLQILLQYPARETGIIHY